MTLGNLGLVAFAEGEFERALAFQKEALGNWRSLHNKPWLARGVEHFALIAAATGDAERAARLFGAAAALRQAFGAAQPPNDREFNERYIAIAREEPRRASLYHGLDKGCAHVARRSVDGCARRTSPATCASAISEIDDKVACAIRWTRGVMSDGVGGDRPDFRVRLARGTGV